MMETPTGGKGQTTEERYWDSFLKKKHAVNKRHGGIHLSAVISITSFGKYGRFK